VLSRKTVVALSSNELTEDSRIKFFIVVKKKGMQLAASGLDPVTQYRRYV
jgi:hypothetical protein